MKKTLSLFLAVLLLVPCGISLAESSPANGSRDDVFTSGDYSWILEEDGSARIVSYNGEEPQITVPGELDGHPVSVISGGAFRELYLWSVTIPEGVTAIESCAFSDCQSLQEIFLPDTLVMIGDEAFSCCTSLQEIILPDSVVSIGEGAFEACYALTSVRLPEGLATIADHAFFYCESLSAIVLPSSLTAIGSWAFSSCQSLTKLVIPDSVTFIGEDAFEDCRKLILTVGRDTAAMRYCDDNDIDYLIDLFSASDDYRYSLEEDGTVRIDRYIGNESDPSVPDNLDGHPVSIIANGAFQGKPIRSVTLPERVTAIGNYAFEGCDRLEQVLLPDNLITVGDNAFCGCESLSEIVLPDHVTSVGESAFSACGSLGSIRISDTVTWLGPCALADCDSLTSVTLPQGLTAVSEGLFSGCVRLEEVILPDHLETIGDMAFWACDALPQIVIPDTVTAVGSLAFAGCSQLGSLELPKGLRSLGAGAFQGTALLEAAEKLDPDSFDTVQDLRGELKKLPKGTTVCPVTQDLDGLLFCKIPSSMRTVDSRAADYILIRRITTQKRNDYAGRAHNTTTEIYLCGRDGSVALIFSATHEPPEYGTVSAGESLGGRAATGDEIWEGIRPLFGR